jgi:hypothetical protein
MRNLAAMLDFRDSPRPSSRTVTPGKEKGAECGNVSQGRRLASEATIRLWPRTGRRVFPPGLAAAASAARQLPGRAG